MTDLVFIPRHPLDGRGIFELSSIGFRNIKEFLIGRLLALEDILFVSRVLVCTAYCYKCILWIVIVASFIDYL